MLEKVIEILLDFTEVEKEIITEKSKLIADLGLNSLDVINIVVTFEEEFNIEIPNQSIKNFVTVGDIVEYLETQANE
jgi:acyl carrier protein